MSDHELRELTYAVERQTQVLNSIADMISHIEDSVRGIQASVANIEDSA